MRPKRDNYVTISQNKNENTTLGKLLRKAKGSES